MEGKAMAHAVEDNSMCDSSGFFSTLSPSEALGEALTVPPPTQEHWWAQSNERVPFSVLQLGSMTSYTPVPPLSCLRCNALQTTDPSYFKSCKYDPIFNPFCPVFRVRDMVEAAGENFGDLALLVLVFYISMEDDSKFAKDVSKRQRTDLKC